MCTKIKGEYEIEAVKASIENMASCINIEVGDCLNLELTDLKSLSDMQDEDIIECYNLFKEFEAKKEESQEKYEAKVNDYIKHLINDMTTGEHRRNKENLEQYYKERDYSYFFDEYDEYYWTILVEEVQAIIEQYELDCYK